MIEELINQLHNNQLMKQSSVFALAPDNHGHILLEDEIIVDLQINDGGEMSSTSYTFGEHQGIQGANNCLDNCNNSDPK